jgi:ankyrin repeat protein
MKILNDQLADASRSGNLEEVRSLIEKGADVRANHDYALGCATFYGRTEVVMFLIEKGANVRAENDEALRRASASGFTDIVRILLKRGANVHASKDAPLKRSFHNGHIEIVRILYEHAKKIGKPFNKDLFKYYKDILPRNNSLNKALYPNYAEDGEFLI